MSLYKCSAETATVGQVFQVMQDNIGSFCSHSHTFAIERQWFSVDGMISEWWASLQFAASKCSFWETAVGDDTRFVAAAWKPTAVVVVGANQIWGRVWSGGCSGSTETTQKHHTLTANLIVQVKKSRSTTFPLALWLHYHHICRLVYNSVNLYIPVFIWWLLSAQL